ncbi:MAG: hypothetical protein VR65_06040 [Desulfobulbaceae bacterium BRH_c16a]|nr:MAG: hypothetical protein VR65_06040 [Desulfobulbaceae bacterium BRH_c16a]
MKLKEISLGSAIHVKHGYAFKGEFFVDNGNYIVLTPGNFNEQGGFRKRPEKDRAYSGDIPESYILNKGDLIVAMTEQGAGLLGSSALIPEGNLYLHNQRLGLIDKFDPSLLDKRFLYFLFNTHSVRGQISGSASGTKVRHTSPERIYQVRVSVPEVKVQEKIADILSNYNDLIENNQRRMALLEDTARQVYQEWFVRLRFPGREHTRIVDCIPEGWQRKPLESALVLQRGFDLPSQSRVKGTIPIFASTGVNGYHNVAKVQAPGVVTGRSGSLGKVHYVNENFWPLNTTLWVKEFRSVSPLFAFFLLSSLRLDQYNGGVSVPTLDRKVVHKMEVIVPTARIQELFGDYVLPMFTQLRHLGIYNEKLRTARDLLLPKLMSGEISV